MPAIMSANTHTDSTPKNEKVNLGYVYLISSVAALGGLLFGYDTGVVAGAIIYMEKLFALDPAAVGWAVSSAIIGCVVGATFAGAISDAIGRKKSLIISAILFALCSILTAIPQNLTVFALGRIIGGLGLGIASMLSPLYIAELAPASMRGRLVSLFQLAIVTGFFIVFYVNASVALTHTEAWNIEYGWRWMFGLSIIPALGFYVMLLMVPESPRWLASKGKNDESLEILTKVNGEEVAKNELSDIQKSLSEHTEASLAEIVQPGIRVALIVGCILAFLQQVTGINAIMYYAPKIFSATGIEDSQSLLSTGLVGTVNLLFTFIALWLIDKVGRKTLLLYGVSGMAICLGVVGLAFQNQWYDSPIVLTFILLYVGCFAASMGPVTWVMISEIFPNKVRGRAMSVATTVLWAATFLVSQCFPMMLDAWGPANTFYFFMVMSVLSVWFFANHIIETKGKSLEDIERHWANIPDAQTSLKAQTNM